MQFLHELQAADYPHDQHTTAASPTSQRYVSGGSHVLLFVTSTLARPIAIRWRLEVPILAAWLPAMALAA